jgi:RHS repeat-associated protein
VSSPAGNQGLLLRPNLTTNTAILQYRFASRDNATATSRPKLTVTYTLPAQAANPAGRSAGHASLSLEPAAPEATPPPNHTWRSYYHAAGRRVAMRVQEGTTGANQLHYLFADHLGSSNVSYRSDGGQTVTQRYYPWGTVRPGPGNSLPTGYTFTGQLDSGAGLMYYGARFYDGALGRFVQPDTIVPEPGNPQSLNRYSYVLNNPLRYTDPTGMFSEDEIMAYLGVSTWDDVLAMFGEGGAMAGAWGYLEVLRQAELGDPISMWYDISSGMTSIAPITGSFYEQDGQLMFGGQIGANANPLFLSAVVFGQMSTNGRASAWSVNNGAIHFILNTQYSHLVFRPDQVDWTAVGLDAMGLAGDAGYAMIGAGIIAMGVGTGGVGLLLGGVVISGLAVAADMTSAGKSLADYQRGQSTLTGLMVDWGMAVGGMHPGYGTYVDAASLLRNFAPGVYYGP